MLLQMAGQQAIYDQSCRLIVSCWIYVLRMYLICCFQDTGVVPLVSPLNHTYPHVIQQTYQCLITVAVLMGLDINMVIAEAVSGAHGKLS